MINPMRHLSVFSPSDFGSRRVDVIGVGATGSRVALELAKLGVENIHVWDFDKVEEHNIPNQVFGEGDIDSLKVDAIEKIILRDTGTRVQKHPEKVDGSQQLGDIVFLLTDSMKSRKQIWQGKIKLNPYVKLMIETRMGADTGIIHSVLPCLTSHIDFWEGTLFEDAEAEVSACGTTTTAGPTAALVSAFAVWQMVRWFGVETGKVKDELESEIVVNLRPTEIYRKEFPKQ